MTRFDDWPRKLEAFFAERRDADFAWGVNDCCLFACDAIQEMTGVDCAEDFRGHYRTALGAARAMRKFSGGGVEQVAEKVTAQFGIAEIPVACAGRGDVVLMETSSGPTLGIVMMNGYEIALAGVLVRPPVTAAKRAWRIG